jgi:threonine dehydratase
VRALGAGPYRCPNDGDGGDHVLGHDLTAHAASFPDGGEANPFLRYRRLTHAYWLAMEAGISDDSFVALVSELDLAVKRVAGVGFVETPFGERPELALALGMPRGATLWVKDETGNVSGSHKARHLMGLAILGEVASKLGAKSDARLAIASCGNAALAAATVARAWGKPLDVLIPEDANPVVVLALTRLGAHVETCPRSAGVAGDPCYLSFRERVRAGWVPFSCQGPDNGLTIEGGETLGWEMLSVLRGQGRSLGRLFLQVGGGALASACIAAYRDAKVPLPKIHAVQTRGAFPLVRAWQRIASSFAERVGMDPSSAPPSLAREMALHPTDTAICVEHATKHRSEVMWPWETPPVSVAHGILDDETYDWLEVVRGMVETGGFPITVSEDDLTQAMKLAHASTGIDVDETGSSGLAGLLALSRVAPLEEEETVGVIFSGKRRS